MELQTDNYMIRVGTHNQSAFVDGQDPEVVSIYQVVNKETGVVEYEDNILPRTIETMMEVQSRLTEVKNKLFAVEPALKLIGEEDVEGGNSIH